MLTRSLRAAGMDVVGEAADGHEALDVCSRHHVDGVVTDVHMRGMGGVATTRALLTAYPHLVVVGYGSDARDHDVMIAAGAAAFVVKGSPVADVIAALVAGRGEAPA